ncbi:hypothetical protein Tco_1184720, partial [Tanacetum coccineum]
MAWYETLATTCWAMAFNKWKIDRHYLFKMQKVKYFALYMLCVVVVHDLWSTNKDLVLDLRSSSASTPVDLEKPLVKDGDADDVDVYLYRSMIRSLMYLTTSRLDIRYLKGNPTLGLWYSRDSPFELVAYTDSDYARATQDRKSTTGGCQFLGNRLISWQCKKQTVVATSSTEAEYVAATSCCGQGLWIQNQFPDYGYNFMNTVINIDNNNLFTKGFDAGRHVKRGQDTKIPQSSSPPVKVGDEVVHKELGDRMEKAATTASSSCPRCQDTILGDVDAQTRFKTTSKQFNDTPFSKVNTFGSGEDSMQLLELMELCTSVKFATTRVQTVYGVRQIQALIDKKKLIITETSIRSDLHLEDAGGTDFLPTATIFKELAKMSLSAKSTTWNEFSSTMDSLIICLATNQKFNLSKYIFDAMQKQKFKRKQRKEAEFAHDETEHEESVLDLEKAKSDQAIEIASLKKMVDKLEKRRKFRTTWLKRLKKVGAARRIESSNDSLGTQEDASKQGRRIKDIDADAGVTLVNETQERQDEDLMFDTRVLDGDEIFVDAITGEKDEQSTKIDDSTVVYIR